MNFADMMEMLRHPEAIQARAEELKRKTESIEAMGSAGGGMVKITLSGSLEMKACEIAPELLNPEEIGMLQDLILAAHNDASAKVREALQQQLTEGMAGAGLPPNLFGGIS